MLLGAWIEVKNTLILLLKNHRKVVEDEKGWVVLSWAQAPGRQTPLRSPADDERWFRDQVHWLC